MIVTAQDADEDEDVHVFAEQGAAEKEREWRARKPICLSGQVREQGGARCKDERVRMSEEGRAGPSKEQEQGGASKQ